MQNRREFLKRASLMLAGGMVMPQLLTSCAGKASACLLYTSPSPRDFL